MKNKRSKVFYVFVVVFILALGIGFSYSYLASDYIFNQFHH